MRLSADAGWAVVVTDRDLRPTRRAPLLHFGIPANLRRETRLVARVMLPHVILTRLLSAYPRAFRLATAPFMGPDQVTGGRGTRQKDPYPSNTRTRRRAAHDEYRALGDLGRRSRRTTRDLGMVYHRPIVGQDSCIIKSLDLRLFSPNELSRHDVIVTQFCL